MSAMSTAPQGVAVADARATKHAIAPSRGGRPWTFYVLAALFVFYVIALYGPMICIYVLSFQDVRGGLVFPMKCRCTGLSIFSPRSGPGTSRERSTAPSSWRYW